MYNNSNAPSNNTTLWHYLGTKHLDFRCESNSTPGVLIEEYSNTDTVFALYLSIFLK